MRNMITITLSLLFSNASFAASVVYINSFDEWSNAVNQTINTVDFESVPGTKRINGDEFASLTASPNFTVIRGTSMFVGNPITGQNLTPVSGKNMLYPRCLLSCEGVIRVDFDQPLVGFGAFFIDVERDFATTGFSLDPDVSKGPQIAFEAPQGQNQHSFLGFTANQPFTSVDIYFATGRNIDGVLIDNLVYATELSTSAVPVPAAAWLLGSGLLGLWRIGKRNC